MRDHGLEVAGDLRLARVGFGHSNLTYIATDEDDHRWIVRRPPHGELLASAHDVEREYRILTALAGTDVPVPVMHLSADRGTLADVPVIVMEFVDGQVVDGFESLDGLRGDVRARLVKQLARVLAAVHAVKIDSVGLDGLASHGAYVPRQLKRWTSQWDRSRTRDLPPLAALTDLLRRNAPPPDRFGLIHGDFSPRNVVIDPGTGAIRAVLDWELSTLGDPTADVGTALAYWTHADLSEGGTRGAEDPKLVAEERAGFVRDYLTESGSEETFVAYWHALGLWKLAIITEGVLRRAIDEPANVGAMSVPTVEEVDRLVDVAAKVARTAGLK